MELKHEELRALERELMTQGRGDDRAPMTWADLAYAVAAVIVGWLLILGLVSAGAAIADWVEVMGW